MSNNDNSDIRVIVTAGAGKGKSTMCALIANILSAHGFNVSCDDIDVMNHDIDIMNRDFDERIKKMRDRGVTIGVSSQQLKRKGPYKP